MKPNALYYGDNLVWLRDHDKFPNESVDLIYLDPPFNSNADYNVIFNEPSGGESQAQLRAFDDTWKWESEAAGLALQELGKTHQETAEFISWLGAKTDKSSRSMAAYLSMMAVRLIELHRVLKPTGSIYLHCDPTASHYLRILMDTVFGIGYFKNEIIWKRSFAHNDPRKYGRLHDTILFYTKGENRTWNKITIPYDKDYIDKYYRYIDKNGRKFLSRSLTAPGGRGPKYEWHGITRNWRVTKENMEKLEKEDKIFYTKNGMSRFKQYATESSGATLQSIWTDILPIVTWSGESLGFQTQKPLALLERIIQASSNEGDIVFDPFCGCGTTVVAAHKLKRHWIGIDVTWLAIDKIEKRLLETFGEAVTQTYSVYGNPYDVTSAQDLWNRNSKEFEIWALSLIGATPRKKDGGVDGVLAFTDEHKKVYKIVAQVKGGETLTPSFVRDLIGTVEKEKAVIGLLICLHEPTSGMKELAIHAGSFESSLWQKSYPRIQIRTIKELLVEGKQFDLPQPFDFQKKATRFREQGQSKSLL